MPTEHSIGSDSFSDRDGTQPSWPLEAMSPDGSPLSSDEEKVSVCAHHVAVGVSTRLHAVRDCTLYATACPLVQRSLPQCRFMRPMCLS